MGSLMTYRVSGRESCGDGCGDGHNSVSVLNATGL